MKQAYRPFMFASYAFILFVLLFLLIFFHFRGVIFYDEGYVLNSALRIVHGQIPYRDFDMAYTPLSFLTTAAFLKIFGESVFAGRLSAFAVSVISLSILYKLVSMFTKRKLYIVLCMLFYIAWGPAHINFPWPVMFAACLLLGTSLFYLQGMMQEKSIYFFLAGVMAALSFFAKQNFGIAILCTFLICFLFLERKDRVTNLVFFISGTFSIVAFATILLINSSSFIPFLRNLDVYTVQRIIIEGTLNTPFLYEGTIIERIAKLIIYISPLLLSVITCILSWKMKNKLFILGLATAAFYVAGIRPTTDYDHFVPLFAISSICFVIITQYTKNLLSIALHFMLACLIILGFYRAYFAGYYKWDPALKYQTAFAANPRFRVYLYPETKDIYTKLTTYVDKHTTISEPIFVYYYAPLVYFMTDRSNATRYDLPFPLPPAEQADAIHNLQIKHVRLVVTYGMTKNDQTSIGRYILHNYRLTQYIGNFHIYTHN